jgi:hypothetical protein
MAEEQGNIRNEFNSANVGLNQDSTLNQIKQGTLTYALNATVENFDANSINYQNESGNVFCVSFPEGYALIGTHFINEQNKHIFFLANPSTGGSEIGYMENNDCKYHTLVSGDCLNFQTKYPIHKAVHRITNCSTEIYWPDNTGRRHLDIDNIPYKLQFGSDICNPSYTNELDCNKLNIQPNFNIPVLKVVDVITGGSNEAGTYQFAIQYSDAVGNPYTSYYSITNPTPLADDTVTSVNFNYNVGKAIVIDVANLETSGEFTYFNLAVIKTVNAISSVELVGTYFISEATKQITYTGQDQTSIRLSINDIFEKFPYYEIADDITTVQDVLVWKGLTSIDRINYQSIATGLTLQWQTYKIPASENYANEINATNLRGYFRDEVYAFEIVFLLDNGKQTDGFHIPGRVIGLREESKAPVDITDDDFIGEPSAGQRTSPYWKIYNTAKVIGTLQGETIGNATPHEYGEFAYWESSEEYPCTEKIWGELAGQKIRHHKFPDVNVSPIFESKLFTSTEALEMGDNAVYPIGVKIDPSQVQVLIQNSNLTSAQKEKIVGFKIIRGNRGTNKSIVAKGMLRNVNKYTKDNTDYFYPNYPYNDVSADPFLTTTNNAFSQLCASYAINVNYLEVDGNGDVVPLKVKYTSCDTNKALSTTYDSFGIKNLCSTTSPVVTKIILTDINNYINSDAGPENTVGLSSYEVYSARTCALCLRGYRVGWVDPINGPSTRWIPGRLGTSRIFLNVVIGTGGVEYVDGKGNPIIEFVETVTGGTNCSGAEQLDGVDTNKELWNRQVFNSPETSFAQPFLGDILKLESVMYGAGKAHFVDVKDNAKYKLLSKEAQEDALENSAKIGAITANAFNATAMFAAYQAYLSIYVNGVTRKNYAKSFNSIASYDYSVGIPNEQGVKQRQLDIKRYLIPSVLSIGDDSNINNYQRETSVYLKTTDIALDAVTEVPALPLPSDNPAILIGGDSVIKDSSRFTLSGAALCGAPTAEKDISVVSYYGSIKNTFINQWGQIYSYETVDTGYQCIFDAAEPTAIFGGDIFIGKFAYKTKLPFFFDNRVKAPDDSDIFYDEVGNVAFPKYWHSARSILSDYTVQSTTLSNFISYKAHSFDCSNEPLPAAGTERTYYDGNFYLFAYGIPSFYCESTYNVDLRAAFNTKEGDYWPHVSSSIPDDWLQESFVSIANDNTYNYNVTYSKQNRENTFTNLPLDWEDKLCFTNYPFRAIYSDLQNTDADSRVNNWLVYKALSYFDFPQNYGALISLDGIQNRAVLARFENKTLMYNNLLTINTSNPQAAYVGNPDIFKGTPPIDFAETDLGYVGSQNKLLLKIPQGQLSIDAKRGQVFLIQGTKAEDISAYGSGMSGFFMTHLSFEILKHYPTTKQVVNGVLSIVKGVNTDNHFNGIGLHAVYDTKLSRIIITKLDYLPLTNDIKYDNSTDEFYIETIVNNLTFRTVVNLKDSDYFCNKSWTISYNLNTKSWISFHSYIPNWYIAENNYFYSGVNGCCVDFDFVVGQLIATPPTTTTTTSSTSSTTTTTTTVIPLDCTLYGEVLITDCTLEGTGVITAGPAPTPCQRPFNMITFELITGYTILSGPTVIVSTGSEQDACNAVTYINSLTDPDTTTSISYINIEAFNIEVGEPVYADNFTQDCTTIADGWYFTDETAFNNTVFYVQAGFINSVNVCATATTTSTTTIAPGYCPVLADFSPSLSSSIPMTNNGSGTYFSDVITYNGAQSFNETLRWYASGQTSYPGLPDTYPYDNAIKTTLSLTTGQTFVLSYFIGSGEGANAVTVNAKLFECQIVT